MVQLPSRTMNPYLWRAPYVRCDSCDIHIKQAYGAVNPKDLMKTKSKLLGQLAYHVGILVDLPRWEIDRAGIFSLTIYFTQNDLKLASSACFNIAE